MKVTSAVFLKGIALVVSGLLPFAAATAKNTLISSSQVDRFGGRLIDSPNVESRTLNLVPVFKTASRIAIGPLHYDLIHIHPKSSARSYPLAALRFSGGQT